MMDIFGERFVNTRGVEEEEEEGKKERKIHADRNLRDLINLEATRGFDTVCNYGA